MQTKPTFLVWVVFPLALVLSCAGEEPAKRPVTPVTVVAVNPSSPENSVAFSAGIISCTQVDVAFKSGGYVESVLQVKDIRGGLRNVQEGDRVRKGAELAQVRKKEYRDSLAQARSQLTEAEATLSKANRDFTRARNLYETESITQPDYDGAKANLQVARAQRAAAAAQVQEAQTSLNDAALKSPLSGVVLQDNVEVGTLVGQGAVGFVVADTLCVKAVFGVPGSMLGEVKLGTPLLLTIVDAGDDGRFEGTITEISPSADPKSRVFDVEVTLSNPDARIKLGMIASLRLGGTDARPDRILIPLGSVVRSEQDRSGYAVFVIRAKDGHTHALRRNVKLGDVFGNRIAVTKGLAPGDDVITRGATLVQEGQEVRVIP